MVYGLGVQEEQAQACGQSNFHEISYQKSSLKDTSTSQREKTTANDCSCQGAVWAVQPSSPGGPGPGWASQPSELGTNSQHLIYIYFHFPDK